MKYGVAFLLLAAAIAKLSFNTGNVIVIIVGCNLVVSFVIVSLGYFKFGASIFQKNSKGVRTWLSTITHWPYFLLNSFTFWLVCKFEKNPPFVEVEHNIYLGRRLSVRESHSLPMPEWHAVLDLAAEFVELSSLRTVPHYRSFPLLDATAPKVNETQELVGWITKQATQGPVFVHCAFGYGRSATLLAAYLIGIGRVSDPDSALKRLVRCRPGVGFNRLQSSLLQRFTEKHAATNCNLVCTINRSEMESGVDSNHRL